MPLWAIGGQRHRLGSLRRSSHAGDGDGLPTPIRMWYNQRDGSHRLLRHRPSTGKDSYELVPRHPCQQQSVSVEYNSAGLAAYPDLLNRYLVAAISISVRKLPQMTSPVMLPTTSIAPRPFAEAILWQTPLRGIMERTDKEKADDLAIMGVCETPRCQSAS